MYQEHTRHLGRVNLHVWVANRLSEKGVGCQIKSMPSGDPIVAAAGATLEAHQAVHFLLRA